MKLNKKSIRLLEFLMIFLAGFLIASILNYYLVYGTEMPVLKTFGLENNGIKKTPFDFIKEEQIEITDKEIIIKVNNASLSRYASTGSMIPVLDSTSNGIRIKPYSDSDIHIGDIITFRDGNNLIVHRVVEKNIDENGVYFITKGDNNSISDGKVRFSDIEYVTIGVIW